MQAFTIRGLRQENNQGGIQAVTTSGIGNVTFPVSFSSGYDFTALMLAQPAASGTGSGRLVSMSGNSKAANGFKGTVLTQSGSLTDTVFNWVAYGK